jgi:hypothetical protein
MKRFTKFFSVLGLVLLLSLGITGLASADVLRGKGWLHAEGAGLAKLLMTGHVEINGHGVGAVYIYGAEHIEAEGSGNRTNLAGGGVVFRGYEGTIKVTGEKMVVKMAGAEIDFTAHGKGTAILRGRGHYETKHFAGDWAPDGLTMEFEEE